jgi:hypothetical protein
VTSLETAEASTASAVSSSKRAGRRPACGKPANGLRAAHYAKRCSTAENTFRMDARTVDDAATRLRNLRREEWEDLGLAVLALGLGIAATQVRPSLAVPLFVGGLAVGILGMRALWRRWDLVERLAGERDAYVIAEVREFATREATTERRHCLAVMIRNRLRQPSPLCAERIGAVAEELDALASELDSPELELDPACAVACVRLLSDVEGSPLLNPALPGDELRSRVCQIRSGFRPRAVACGSGQR